MRTFEARVVLVMLAGVGGCAMEDGGGTSVAASVNGEALVISDVCFGVTLSYAPDPGTFVTLHFLDDTGEELLSAGPIAAATVESGAMLSGPVSVQRADAVYIAEGDFDVRRSRVAGLPSPATDTYAPPGFEAVTGDIAASIDAVDAAVAPSGWLGTVAPGEVAIDVAGSFVADHCVDRDRAVTD